MSESSAIRKRAPGLPAVIAISLILGIAAGLVFGEYTSWIKWIGDAFVGLLQMAVLPYVAVSLVASVGRLSLTVGARLMRVSVAVLLLLWIVGLVTLAIMKQAFPTWETGSFFSSSFTDEAPVQNWLDLFIPSNPFRSLSDNLIPAVVVFSIGLGIALMSIPNKATLLEPLDVVVEALTKLNKLVVKLTPVGMFAIVADTAGSIDTEKFILIQGYLLVYATSAVILSFVVLPLLVTAVTPFSFRDIVKAASSPLIAAFVIGNSFVVLPMIIEAIKGLQEKSDREAADRHEPDYLVPLAYPFPDIGRIVGLIFIPFAAWFYGHSIDLARYPALTGVGLLGSFGKPVTTIPLLLDIAELPGDIFNLYIASGVVAARFGDLMKTMHLIAFTILVSCIINGSARRHWQKLFMFFLASVSLLLMTSFLIRGFLDSSFTNQFSKAKLLTERQMIFPHDRPASGIDPVELASSSPNPDRLKPGQTRVERIKQRGFIRIGFDPDKMPFAYYDSRQRLVGFDIEMAWYLADDLQVNIEFVPIDRQKLQQQLVEDHFDVAMSAQEGTVNQAAFLPATNPYMETTLAIVVHDYHKHKFRDVGAIRDISNLKLGVVRGTFFAERAPLVFPEKQDFQIVQLESAAEYFEGRHVEVDGIVMGAEAGSAWTLLYPEFTIANPIHGEIKVPLYYLTASDRDFQRFMQNWLTLKRADGTYDRLYNHWILGQEIEQKKPRWCIIRDVLKWVD